MRDSINTPKVVEKYWDSVVWILKDDSTNNTYAAGSGVIVHTTKDWHYILTNFHVVENGSCKNKAHDQACAGLTVHLGKLSPASNSQNRPEVLQSDPHSKFEKTWNRPSLVWTRPERDLALLQVPRIEESSFLGFFKSQTGPLDFPEIQLELNPQNLFKSGQSKELFMIGHPDRSLRPMAENLSREQKREIQTSLQFPRRKVWSQGNFIKLDLEKGRYAYDDGKKPLERLLHHSIDCLPGNSGGPIFTADGRLVAIEQGVQFKNPNASNNDRKKFLYSERVSASGVLLDLIDWNLDDEDSEE